MIFIHIIYDDMINLSIMIITYEKFYICRCILFWLDTRVSSPERHVGPQTANPLPQIWTPSKSRLYGYFRRFWGKKKEVPPIYDAETPSSLQKWQLGIIADLYCTDSKTSRYVISDNKKVSSFKDMKVWSHEFTAYGLVSFESNFFFR